VDTHHLFCDHDNGLETKPPVAVVEEVLEGWTEQVDNQDVVETFLTKVVDIGNTSCVGAQRVSMYSS
jgi:hypothetical protein